MPLEARDKFRADLGLVSGLVQSIVIKSYTRKKDGHWELWFNFSSKIGIDPHLKGIVDLIPYLQVFGAQYRYGCIAPHGCGVKSVMVCDTIQLVGQRFASTGTVGPHLNTFSKINFCIRPQLLLQDRHPPKNWLKPLLVCIVLRILEFAFQTNQYSMRMTIANLVCITFYFCL